MLSLTISQTTTTKCLLEDQKVLGNLSTLLCSCKLCCGEKVFCAASKVNVCCNLFKRCPLRGRCLLSWKKYINWKGFTTDAWHFILQDDSERKPELFVEKMWRDCSSHSIRFMHNHCTIRQRELTGGCVLWGIWPHHCPQHVNKARLTNRYS